MEIKKLTAIYFSPTGGTKALAMRIGTGIMPDAEGVDITVKASPLSFAADEAVIIAAPVFGGRIPQPVAERFEAISADNTPAVLLAVYGNRAFEDALLELRCLADERGFKPFAAAAFIARHSMANTIAAGRPDASDLEKAQEFATKVKERLDWARCAEELPTVIVPGELPLREAPKAGMHPHGSKTKCGRCGKCSAECPTQAISPETPWDTDKTRCIGCMRCVAICPHYSRSLGKVASLAVLAMLKGCASARREPELFI